MSDFHGRVMNIECNMSASICRPAEDTALAYKYGHRDARHAAAEIANEADRAIRDAGAAIASKDAEIARLRDALDQSALEYADLAVSAKSLEEHLHALVEVSEDSTIARARAVMNGDDIGEDEDAARAGNGGGV